MACHLTYTLARKDGVIPGRLPELDKLMQKVMVEQGIDDRVLKRRAELDGRVAGEEELFAKPLATCLC